jgi:hypothetical protein
MNARTIVIVSMLGLLLACESEKAPVEPSKESASEDAKAAETSSTKKTESTSSSKTQTGDSDKDDSATKSNEKDETSSVTDEPGDDLDDPAPTDAGSDLIGSCRLLYSGTLETCEEFYGDDASALSECAYTEDELVYESSTEACPTANVRNDCGTEPVAELGVSIKFLIYDAAPQEVSCEFDENAPLD